jgi:putative ABC transport system permease protein
MSPSGWLRQQLETVAQAVATVRTRPLRSALGALAIAVAVATLTLVDTAIVGLAAFAEKSATRAFGSDTFVLAQVASPGQLPRRELAKKLERNQAIRRTDLRTLERYADGRVVYAATAQREADVIAGARKFEGAAVSGTNAPLAEIRDLSVAQGRFFVADEDARGEQVVVLGFDVATALFPSGDPLGQTVRLGGRGFTVVGVQAQQGTAGGVSLDRNAWVPLLAFERTFGVPATLQVSAKPTTGWTVELAEDRAVATLRAQRQLAPGEEDTFDLLTPEAARGFVAGLVRRISAVAPLLSFMALLTAVVVVTNTTLVSVAQRTWEIGLRRALGATRGQILSEVLAEAVLISLAGGLAGALLVAGLARLAAGPLGIELAVRPAAFVFALVASALSGLVAGWYPARRAARVDVITALRAE